RRRIAGTVNAVQRVAPVLIEVEGARTEGVLGTARHAAVGEPGQVRFACDHLLGRVPAWPGLLVADDRLAAPAETLASDPDTIADGRAILARQVQEARIGIDDARARLLLGDGGNELPAVAWIDCD